MLTQEGHEGKVELEGDEPQTVDAFIHYLYNFDYGDFGNSQGDVPALVLDVRMFIIADKYNVAPLLELAVTKFKERCEQEWMKPEFGEAALELYSIGLDHNTSLRDVIVGTINKHASEVLDPDRKSEFSKLHEVMEQTELGAHVAARLASRVCTYKCPKTNCGRVFQVSVAAYCNFSCPNKCYNQDETWWEQQPKPE